MELLQSVLRASRTILNIKHRKVNGKNRFKKSAYTSPC